MGAKQALYLTRRRGGAETLRKTRRTPMRSQNPRARSQRRRWGLRCEAYAPGEAGFVRPSGPARKGPDALRNMRQPAYEADGARPRPSASAAFSGLTWLVLRVSASKPQLPFNRPSRLGRGKIESCASFSSAAKEASGRPVLPPRPGWNCRVWAIDRKSGVWGKSVKLGGRPSI